MARDKVSTCHDLLGWRIFPAPPIYMYCAAKSGVVGLMRGLRSEVVKKNVTVNTVAPWMTGNSTLVLHLLKSQLY